MQARHSTSQSSRHPFSSPASALSRRSDWRTFRRPPTLPSLKRATRSRISTRISLPQALTGQRSHLPRETPPRPSTAPRGSAAEQEEDDEKEEEGRRKPCPPSDFRMRRAAGGPALAPPRGRRGERPLLRASAGPDQLPALSTARRAASRPGAAAAARSGPTELNRSWNASKKTQGSSEGHTSHKN